MSGICDTFGGSIVGDVLTFNPDAIPEPDTLVIRMTRGERRIADELRKSFGGFERVIIDVDGERHEFNADSFIGLLESYERAQGTNNYMRLFGTPERAANVILALQICPCVKDECVFCPAHDVCFEHYKGGRTVYEMAEWLREDCVHHD